MSLGPIVPADDTRFIALLGQQTKAEFPASQFWKNLLSQTAVLCGIDVLTTTPNVGDFVYVEHWLSGDGFAGMWSTTVGAGHSQFSDNWRGELVLPGGGTSGLRLTQGGVGIGGWSYILWGYWSSAPASHYFLTPS